MILLRENGKKWLPCDLYFLSKKVKNKKKDIFLVLRNCGVKKEPVFAPFFDILKKFKPP